MPVEHGIKFRYKSWNDIRQKRHGTTGNKEAPRQLPGTLVSRCTQRKANSSLKHVPLSTSSLMMHRNIFSAIPQVIVQATMQRRASSSYSWMNPYQAGSSKGDEALYNLNRRRASFKFVKPKKDKTETSTLL